MTAPVFTNTRPLNPMRRDSLVYRYDMRPSSTPDLLGTLRNLRLYAGTFTSPTDTAAREFIEWLDSENFGDGDADRIRAEAWDR